MKDYWEGRFEPAAARRERMDRKAAIEQAARSAL
jgi:hypothetical protein